MDIISIKQKLFQKYYSFLNDSQKEAVFSVNGPLLVVAGAGSGKTTVLVHRIAHIIKYGNAYYSDKAYKANENEIQMLKSFAENDDTPKEVIESVLSCFKDEPCEPDRILAITFTNKAANEIKERLNSSLGEISTKIWSGTFHSICVRILKMFAERTTISKDFSIYDKDDSKKLIQSIMSEMQIDDNEITAKFVMNEISRAKNKFITPNEYSETYVRSDKYKTVAEIYQKYQERLTYSNALDFDDIISKAVELIKNDEYVSQWCNEKFKYILVDEYQDTNKAQYLLLREISKKYKNIMAVGDDDQSIYKFRGAVVENILNFDKDFKDSKVVFLEQNYRSTKMIVEAANALIANNTTRRGKTLWSGNSSGDKIKFILADDQEKEASEIADKISELVSSGKYTYRDFAVLYRARAQSNAIEEVFVKSGIPHRVLAGTRFFERAEIKDIIAYLRLIHNPDDEISLQRIINVPKRSIGQKSLDNCRIIAEEEKKSLFEVIKNCQNYESLSRAKAGFIKFSNLITELIEFSKNHLPSEIVAEVINKTDYFDYISGIENQDKRENVEELKSSAIKFEEDAENPTFDAFLENLSLVSDVDNYDESANAVVLMTIHSAKGLEFPVVFLPGMEETIFPSSMSAISETETEEERRLCYVALTRAKKELYLLSCRKRLLYGRTNFNRLSRFVTEIPERFYDTPPVTTVYSSPRAETSTFYSSDYIPKSNSTVHSNLYRDAIKKGVPKKEKSEIASFAIGDRVNHKLFGNGTIISSKNFGGDILYEIDFDSQGIKKLMATYARLTKI